MSFRKFILATTSGLLFTACAPAAQQSADNANDDTSAHAENSHMDTHHAKTEKGSPHMATVKPGASVTLKSVLPKAMTSGTFHTVKLELSDGYQDGIMTVSIEPSDGLTLFAGSNSKTFDMSNPGPHVWDVDVKADADGVYFLNVFSQAQGMPRSFSVRLNVGVVTQKMFDDKMPADGELTEDPDGSKIRVLEATETIQ